MPARRLRLVAFLCLDSVHPVHALRLPSIVSVLLITFSVSSVIRIFTRMAAPDPSGRNVLLGALSPEERTIMASAPWRFQLRHIASSAADALERLIGHPVDFSPLLKRFPPPTRKSQILNNPQSSLGEVAKRRRER